MALTEASLREHQLATGCATPSRMSGSISGASRAAATTYSSRRCSARPQDNISGIVGFARPSSAVNQSAAASICGDAASSYVAVGHGSIRPPPSVCSRSVGCTTAGDGLLLESLEAQLDEERRGRLAMEKKIESLCKILQDLPPPESKARSSSRAELPPAGRASSRLVLSSGRPPVGARK